MYVRKIVLLVLVGVIGFMGCAMPPKTFVRTMEPTWAAMEVRQQLMYDKTWTCLVDLLVKRFDLEMLDKENGYIRTGWLYTWTGEMVENYRVRVTIKFNEDRRTVQLKSEAHYKGRTGWILGSDTRLLSTLKTDIMGLIGRTTR